MIAPELLTRSHVRPIGSNVVILPIYAERDSSKMFDVRTTASGIALPDSVDDEPIEGVVVAIGDGMEDGCPKCYPQGKKHQFELKVGDKVLFCLWLCTSIFLDGNDYLICAERDVLGIQSSGDEAALLITA